MARGRRDHSTGGSNPSSLYVSPDGAEGSAELPHHLAPIPSAAEAAGWTAALSAVEDLQAGDVGYPVDLAMRYAQLVYGRDSGELARSCLLRPQSSALDAGEVDAVELQLRGVRAGALGAYCTAYLYRVDKGVGVVLTFRCPTSGAPERVESLSLQPCVSGGELFFPDLAAALGTSGTAPRRSAEADIVKAKVLPSLLGRYASVCDTMRGLSMASLRGMLEEWGAPSEAPDFFSWLQTPGSWCWLAACGHSAGGAVATLAATDIAVRGGGGPVFLTSIGSPSVGNKSFVRLQSLAVSPRGGLRIFNMGDDVPSLGYARLPSSRSGSKGKDTHSGRPVPLSGELVDKLDTYRVHLQYQVPSHALPQTAGGLERPRLVTFTFPGSVADSSGGCDDDESLGDRWLPDRTMAHSVHTPVPQCWDEDFWWLRPPPADVGRDAPVPGQARGGITRPSDLSGAEAYLPGGLVEVPRRQDSADLERLDRDDCW